MQLQQTLPDISLPPLVLLSHLCFPAAGLPRMLPDVPSFATVNNNSSRCEVLTTDLITSCNGHLPSTAPPPGNPAQGESRPAACRCVVESPWQSGGAAEWFELCVKCWQVLRLVEGHRRGGKEGETAAVKAADCAVCLQLWSLRKY